jgi:hypothetical protein
MDPERLVSRVRSTVFAIPAFRRLPLENGRDQVVRALPEASLAEELFSVEECHGEEREVIADEPMRFAAPEPELEGAPKPNRDPVRARRWQRAPDEPEGLGDTVGNAERGADVELVRCPGVQRAVAMLRREGAVHAGRDPLQAPFAAAVRIPRERVMPQQRQGIHRCLRHSEGKVPELPAPGVPIEGAVRGRMRLAILKTEQARNLAERFSQIHHRGRNVGFPVHGTAGGTGAGRSLR